MAELEGDLFLIAKGLGSLVSLAAVAKTEPCCATSPRCTGSMERQQRLGETARDEKWRRGTVHALFLQNLWDTAG